MRFIENEKRRSRKRSRSAEAPGPDCIDRRSSRRHDRRRKTRGGRARPRRGDLEALSFASAEAPGRHVPRRGGLPSPVPAPSLTFPIGAAPASVFSPSHGKDGVRRLRRSRRTSRQTDKGRREPRRRVTAGADFVQPRGRNSRARQGPRSPRVICRRRRIFYGES